MTARVHPSGPLKVISGLVRGDGVQPGIDVAPYGRILPRRRIQQSFTREIYWLPENLTADVLKTPRPVR